MGSKADAKAVAARAGHGFHGSVGPPCDDSTEASQCRSWHWLALPNSPRTVRHFPSTQQRPRLLHVLPGTVQTVPLSYRLDSGPANLLLRVRVRVFAGHIPYMQGCTTEGEATSEGNCVHRRSSKTDSICKPEQCGYLNTLR